MNVDELIEYLLILKEEGKGSYTVLDEGYLNEISKENIMIDDVNKEITL